MWQQSCKIQALSPKICPTPWFRTGICWAGLCPAHPSPSSFSKFNIVAFRHCLAKGWSICSTCSTYFPSGLAPGEESGEAVNQFTEVDERLECADLNAEERLKTCQSKPFRARSLSAVPRCWLWLQWWNQISKIGKQQRRLQQGSLNNLCNFYATQGYYIIDYIIDCILFWIVSLFYLGGFLDFVFFFSCLSLVALDFMPRIGLKLFWVCFR